MRLNLPKTFFIDDVPLHFLGVVGEELLNIVDGSGIQFLIEDTETAAKRMPDFAFIEQMMIEERYREALPGPFSGNAAGPDPAFVANYRRNLDPDEIAKRDPKARKRLFVVRELRKLNCVESDPMIGALLDKIWTPEVEAEHGEKPKAKTVRRWLALVRGLQIITLGDVMNGSGLAPRKPSAKRLDPVMREIVKEAARYYYVAGPGFRLVDVEARINDRRKAENARREADGGVEPALKQPSRETVRRAILSIRCRDTLLEKHGEEWVKRRWKVSGPGLTTYRALQVGLIDDKMLDLVTVLGDDGTPIGKPWICVIVDVHTRCVLGWWIDFSDPTVYTATQAFKHACKPKVVPQERLSRWPILAQIYGLLSELIADNGSNYASPAWQDVLADVGTALRHAAVFTPQHKAILERLFRTLDTMLTAKLPGYVSKEMAHELGIDATKEAVVTISELRELIEMWVYVYHITLHSKLQMPPARAFELSAGKYPINVLGDPKRLDQFMADTYTVRGTKNGFQIKGHWWRDRKGMERALDAYAGVEKARDRLKRTASAWMKVRVNRANLLEAHVWDPVAKEYFTVTSATPDYSAGLSLYAHEQIQAWAKKQGLEFASDEDRLEARHALNQRVRDLLPDVDFRERRAMARLLGSGIVQDRQDIAIAEAEPRHDGLAPVNVVSAAADEREDGHHLTGRPARKPKKPTAESPLDSTLEDETADPDADWESAGEAPGDRDDTNPETDPDSDWEDK